MTNSAPARFAARRSAARRSAPVRSAPGEVAAPQVGAEQQGTAQAGPTQVGRAQVGAGQVGAAEVRPPSPRARSLARKRRPLTRPLRADVDVDSAAAGAWVSQSTCSSAACSSSCSGVAAQPAPGPRAGARAARAGADDGKRREHQLGGVRGGAPVDAGERVLGDLLARAEAVVGGAAGEPALAQLRVDRAAERLVEVRTRHARSLVEGEVRRAGERRSNAAEGEATTAVGFEVERHAPTVAAARGIPLSSGAGGDLRSGA